MNHLIVGKILGIIMLLNNCGSVAPKSLAAFNILLFISYSCGKTIITTIGMQMQYEILELSKILNQDQ